MADKSTSWRERLDDFPDLEREDCSSEELREFLEADSLEPLADVGFKRRLRRMLWDILRSQPEDRKPSRG
jgi:hypothetical protein